MQKRTIAWCWAESFLIEVVGAEPVDDAEWGKLVAEIARRRASLRGVLVVTVGGTPSASQRAELTAALQGSSVPAAILNDSMLVRMALTAINYFVRGLARQFSPDQLDAALLYLKVPESLWPQVRGAITDLQVQVRPQA
jgi:hypothetical protein